MDRLVVGNNYAKCAVDIALHDLWGKTAGLPIYRLLGGAVRESVAIAHMVGLNALIGLLGLAERPSSRPRRQP